MADAAVEIVEAMSDDETIVALTAEVAKQNWALKAEADAARAQAKYWRNEAAELKERCKWSRSGGYWMGLIVATVVSSAAWLGVFWLFCGFR